MGAGDDGAFVVVTVSGEVVERSAERVDVDEVERSDEVEGKFGDFVEA